MQSPPIPQNEEARLTALYGLEVLDTPAEERFDRYTRLCRRIFEVPIALISLVDRYRQWFKSRQGLDVSETSRRVSFCGHAIADEAVFEVRNARRDPRFRNNPLVTGNPHIRFYAGAPLVVPDGYRLGTLCIIDRVPRWLDDDEKLILADMADMVVGELTSYVDLDSGAFNRNGLRALCAKALRADDRDAGLTLLVFDIRHLVRNLDAGQSRNVLKMFARMLRETFSAAQVVSHLGQGGFCVLVTEPDEAAVSGDVMALLQRAVAAIPCNPAAATAIYVGEVRANRDRYPTIDVLMREVDARFHEAGRDSPRQR